VLVCYFRCHDEVVEKDGHGSVDDVQIIEVMQHISDWLAIET
tara:strand:+ start:1068 stop:1193 length:126 start_codon:yes stop_codon:yes gene_type:complete